MSPHLEFINIRERKTGLHGDPAVYVLMKKLFYIFTVVLLFLAGCSFPVGENRERIPDEKQTAAEAPTYERSTSQFRLAEDANSYMTDYAQNGFFYFVMGENVYQFYYQTYDGKDAIPFCVITDGYVRDFSGVTKDGGLRLAVLRIGGEASILEYDEAGNNCGKAVIDGMFNNLEEFSKLLARPDGGYAIGMSDKVFLLDSEGQITETIEVDGIVRELYAVGENELFATVEKNEGRSSALCLTRLNVQKSQMEMARNLPSDLMGLFAFEDGFVSVLGDRVIFFHTDKEDEEVLIDLNRQSLLASQIQYVFGNREEIKLVSMEPSDQGQKAYLFTLREKTAPEGTDGSKESEQELYAPDGRRIVRVAIPQGYPWQVEFHAKKYNQTSDKTFVEIERFEGSLEDFLGKGNRPDVIMFNDQTEVAAYVQKGVLTDLLPLFQGQEKYSLEGIIPKARELLGAESADGMYAMAGRFRMLLRTSDGTEYDSVGKCDGASYLKWYDNFMTENEIGGMGAMENLLYANVGAFYDENTAEASFTSGEFIELMEAYKDVYDRHKGDVDRGKAAAENGYTGREIAGGSRWYASYSCQQLTEGLNIKLEGLPGPDGENHVYMKLDYPMSIMSTSDCKEAAFDFIMYYNSLAEFLMMGDTEAAYGKAGNTGAFFSVYEEILKEEIYESERPYSSIGGEFYFTEEQNGQLKYLIDCAVSDTKTQRDIYDMLMEEMDAYLHGGKDLDNACEILQNRAELYLKEHM